MNKEESLALYRQGKEAWNAWANALLAEKAELAATGGWPNKAQDWENRAGIDFSEHEFIDVANFRDFIFPDFVNFSEAIFLTDADFSEANFSGYAGFSEANFSRYTDFRKATFSTNADFFEATFSAYVDFNDATFLANASFIETTFSAITNFTEVIFANNAFFTSAKFEGLTLFNNAKFIPIKDEPARNVDFTAIHVAGYFSLEGVTFEEVPNFTQAHFQQAASFDEIDIKTSKKHPSPKRGEVNENKPENLAPRWRHLRRLATQGHDHENEKNFFASEIQSRRGVTDFWFGKNWQRHWFGHTYEVFSDFGRSIWRPLLAWVFSTLAYFFLCYATYESALRSAGRTWTNKCLIGDGNPAVYALKIAFDNALILPMFGTSDGHVQENLCLFKNDIALTMPNRMPVPLVPDWVAGVGFVHALFSAVMIFLVLFALRNQFRIR